MSFLALRVRERILVIAELLAEVLNMQNLSYPIG